jgi:hypothetical protein
MFTIASTCAVVVKVWATTLNEYVSKISISAKAKVENFDV